jgi:hypothetical protein
VIDGESDTFPDARIQSGERLARELKQISDSFCFSERERVVITTNSCGESRHVKPPTLACPAAFYGRGIGESRDGVNDNDGPNATRSRPKRRPTSLKMGLKAEWRDLV